MEQVTFESKKLILKVRTYLAVKILFCFMSIVMLLGPLIGLILWISDGNGLHVKFLFGFAFSYTVGYYVLKHTLWNTWGKEIYEFEENQITFTIDYKFFKQKKVFKNAEVVEFGYAPFGYEEDNKGRLFIQLKGQSIISAVTISIPDLQKLINKLITTANDRYNT